MTTIVKTSKPFRGMWNGVPATQTTHHLDSSKLGLRIDVMEFANHANIRLIRGDGRRADFRVIAMLNVGLGEVAEAVAHLTRPESVDYLRAQA